MAPRKGATGRALYDFLGEAAGDLVFFKDQVVTDIVRIDADWCRGRMDRYEGIFPSNLVAYDSPPPLEGEDATAPVVEEKAKEPHAIANLDFVAEDAQELTVLKGDVVILTSHVDDNWFRGTLGGKSGIFPKMCVDVVVALPANMSDDVFKAKEAAKSSSLLSNDVGKKAASSPGAVA
eukprot:Opistho-2@87688